MKKFKLQNRSDDYMTYVRGITDILDALGFQHDIEVSQESDHADVLIEVTVRQRGLPLAEPILDYRKLVESDDETLPSNTKVER